MATVAPAPSSSTPAAPTPSGTAASPPPSISPPPPPQSSSPPPTATTSPPPPQDDPTPPPPPSSQPPPPATPSTPPPSGSPPPSSPPPTPPALPPPAPPSDPPTSPPPTPQPPPNSRPPPPPSTPAPDIQPPPSSAPPESSPPPETPSQPPRNSPPPSPPSIPPRSAPPPPSNASLPPIRPPPAGPNSTQTTTPPVVRLAPPPPSRNSPPSSVNNDTIPNGPSDRNGGAGGLGTPAIVGIGLTVGILMLSLIVVIACCIKKRRRVVSRVNGDYVMPSPFASSPISDSSYTKTQSTTAPLMGSGSSSDFISSPPEPGLGHSRSLFTYEEMVTATNGFSSQNLLGEGGFGCVYKGCLPDGTEVAVKQLNIRGSQGEREFKAEVDIISRVHHRHLVSLVGYCISDSQRLLVYEYVPNNTLDFHLHGDGVPVLDWPQRIKIAAGAARGLAYLHRDCHPRIIHRDIKSSNILLDSNFEAKVSDFGLAKFNPDANTHLTTRVMGTYGYVAPEYATSGKLTDKSDVYSFGVVLLELITGQKPLDPSQSPGKESLVERARPFMSHALVSGELGGLIDPRLDKNYVEEEMLRMIEAAAACVRHSAAKRPRMEQIVRALGDIAAADLTNGMKIGESEVMRTPEESEQFRIMQRMAFGSQDFSSGFFTHSSMNSRNDSLV